MPTKPNSAGEQQDYVPAGNGDPSGEYADEAGANIHFHVFKKPDGQAKPPATPTEPKQEKPKEEVKKGGQEFFDKFVDSDQVKGDAEFKTKLKEAVSNGNQPEKDLFMKMVDTYNIAIEQSKVRDYYDGSVNLSGKIYDSPNYAKGAVAYHEMGHAIDSAFTAGEFYEHASSTIVLSNGKTLNKTILEDTHVKDFEKNALKDVEDFKVKIGSQLLPNYAELKKEDDESYQKELALRQSLIKKSIAETGGYNPDEISNNPEVLKLEKRISEVRSELWKVHQQISDAVAVEFGDVSDMFQGSIGSLLANMGHPSSYFRRNVQLRGTEFFAECFSAEATNPASLKRIKQYFPKGYNAFRELYDKITKGEIQSGWIKKTKN